MNLTNFSVKNYQFTLIMFIMVAVVGVVTLITMPRAEDPQINPPQFPIVIIYPGTSPKDLEELVVKPVENKMNELDNIDKITSDIQDGYCIVKVEFKYGQNIDNKYQEVIREMNALKSTLPKDIANIDVKKVDPSDVNVLQIGLVSETASTQAMKDKADDLKEALEKIPSLKKVKVSGLPEQLVRVDLNLQKMAQLNIPLNTVLGSIQSEDANIPGGSLNAGAKTFNVKTSGKYKGVDDIANTVVFNGNGKIVHLKDLASVTFRNDEEHHITRLNGHRAVVVTAAQKTGANIGNTQKAYLPVLESFKKDLPAKMTLVTHFDQGENVNHRLLGLSEDFLIAIGLVMLTLLPLGFRASFIVMIAIPLSLALGLVGLNAFGISLNQLSIVGLVVALGLLVDDSIVVVENIERWLREGHSKMEAAIKATQQIGMAVLGTTATLVIAFMPLVFLPAGPGEFIRGLPLAVITSVVSSMLVSLTVVPFLSSRILKEHHDAEGNFLLRAMKKGINASYSKLMHRALQFPKTTLVVAGMLFVGAILVFPRLGFKLFPASEKPIFLVNLRFPLQTSIQENDRITKMVEDSLSKNKAIEYFTTNVGKGNPQVYYNVAQQEEKIDFTQFFIQLNDETKPNDKQKIIGELREQFRNFPYAVVEVKDFEQGPQIEAPISVRVFGDNLDTLRKLAYSVEKIIRGNKDVLYVNNETNILKTDIKVNIDREKARTLGILTVDIDRTVRLAVAGLQMGTYTDEKGDNYKITVDVPKEKYADLNVLENLYVNNALGTAIPLNQVASIGFETSPTAINHFNKSRFVKVNASVRQNVLTNHVLKEILPQLNALPLPKGYYYKLSGEAESEGDAFGGSFVTVILLSVFLFTAVLILQFKTFKGLLIILSVIPLGVVGGVSMLWLTGNPMSFVAIIGFIALAGVEVKNSILLVDFTNQLRAEGVALNEAIEQAGETRFLPVILTSLTAIGGLIPIAINPNPLISPLALVLIGGLISSTILSRIVTPVMYKLIPPSI